MQDNIKELLYDLVKDQYTWKIASRDKTKLSYVRNGRGQYLSKAQVANEIFNALHIIPSYKSVTIQDVNDYMDWFEEEEIKKINSSKPVSPAKPKINIAGLSQAASWIYEQVMSKECPFSTSSRADCIMYKNGSTEINATEKNLISWLNQRVRDLGIRDEYRIGDIADGWDLLKKHLSSVVVNNLCETMKYDASFEGLKTEFIKYLYQYLQIEEDYDVFEMLFSHWMWYLKRRIFNKDVVWHIWINFMGAQGIGKTQMIMRMLKPFEDYMVNTSLATMSDITKEYMKFTDNYVIFLDELNTGDNNDNQDIQLSDGEVDAIKQLMTQEYLTVRLYGTQTQAKVKNTFAPISCANKHLYDILFDGDAMRRWFEFNCKRESAPKDYSELNAMLAKFPEVMKGIDENNDNGYWIKGSEVDKKIVNIQKSYVPTHTSTNLWIRDCVVTPDYDKLDYTKFDGPEFNLYKDYCKCVGKFSASLERVEGIIKRLWPQCIDDEGHPHIFIDYNYDITNGTKYENTARHAPKLSTLVKQPEPDDPYTPTIKQMMSLQEKSEIFARINHQ